MITTKLKKHWIRLGLILHLLVATPGVQARSDGPPPDIDSVEKAGTPSEQGHRPDQEPQGDLDALALQQAAEMSGVAVADLSIAYSTTAETVVGTLVAYKVMGNLTGDIYSVTLNQTGERIDIEQLVVETQSTYRDKYGQLDATLVEQLAATPEDALVDVIIWLHEPTSEPMAAPDAEAFEGLSEGEAQARVETFVQQIEASRAAVVETVTGPVMARLEAQGIKVTADQFAPAVYASLSPTMIKALSQWAEVDRIYASPAYEPTLDVARVTTGADEVWRRHIAGFGVKVGVLEVGGRINTANPYLAGVTQDTTFSCFSSHADAVIGILRSWHPLHFGIASGATTWVGGSCSGNVAEVQNRATAAANWGARALNLSLGCPDCGRTPTALDRFLDNLVRNLRRTVVVAAGNTRLDVTSPGLAYNVITVGAFNDLNTTSWSSDTMAAFSGWQDPLSTSGDREKPEVVAPGVNFNSSITVSPWVGEVGSGTSYAAPVVTGGAALLMQRDPAMQLWPEAVKAILMVTADHNLEGAARLSERDGAGGISLARADEVVRGVNGNRGFGNYTCATAPTLNVTTMSLTAGVRTRVALVWDTNPNYASYASRPGADLDLQVIRPGGAVVASSVSFDNTYEIVDFTSPVSGSYTLRVIKFRCNASPNWFAWAWHRPVNSSAP